MRLNEAVCPMPATWDGYTRILRTDAIDRWIDGVRAGEAWAGAVAQDAIRVAQETTRGMAPGPYLFRQHPLRMAAWWAAQETRQAQLTPEDILSGLARLLRMPPLWVQHYVRVSPGTLVTGLVHLMGVCR